MYKLYRRKLSNNFPGNMYVWVNPEGIVFEQRMILPYGYIWCMPEENLIGNKFKTKGWNKVPVVNTEHKQECLSKGYLLYS